MFWKEQQQDSSMADKPSQIATAKIVPKACSSLHVISPFSHFFIYEFSHSFKESSSSKVSVWPYPSTQQQNRELK